MIFAILAQDSVSFHAFLGRVEYLSVLNLLTFPPFPTQTEVIPREFPLERETPCLNESQDKPLGRQ